MKQVNVKALDQYLAHCGCVRIASPPIPLHFNTDVDIKCKCGNKFVLSVKKIGGYNRRKSLISCGCTAKKWTNDNIDHATSDRPLRRLTDCNIVGFQPSTSPIQWKCNDCNYEWQARADSVINKQSGCPQCAGNVPYTIYTLTDKLLGQGRRDLVVNEVFSGSFTGGVRHSRSASFTCTKCKGLWVADIHNVIKFGYGCPTCNNNVSTRVEVDGLKFHSKLEYYFWKQYHSNSIPYEIRRQHKYLPSRRLTCDYYIPEKSLWIEVTGGSLLKNKKYSSTIEEKRCIVNQRGDRFVTLTTLADINNFITSLRE